MKIVVTGTRGIPNIQGGVETHCEELFPRIARLGCDITVVRRSCYVTPGNILPEYNGVKLKTIYAPHLKSFEAVTHTFLSVIWARKAKADVVHIHAIGPAIMSPLARLLGLKVVFTHHGPDYRRAKWGPYARVVLRLGERAGSVLAHEVIVISTVIRDLINKKYKRGNANLIYNGVPFPVMVDKTGFIESLGLKSRSYIFTLGRLVEEKGFDLLIRAFSRLKNTGVKLVISGDADHETSYSRKLKSLARENGVILTGFLKGEKLQELFSHARLFVLPSFHEGLPISLLEAMSYRL
ncbi:MAG TPA: glycosyl transferase family 1, partial [Bacteroidales bacterium]|nr:glycosyl transferase family 1 [Bacteroidales bacterium]